MWRKISCHFRKTSTQFDFWQSLNVQELKSIVEFWLNLISSFHSFHYWWNKNKEMSITGIYRIVADVKYIVFPNIFIMLHSVIFHFSKKINFVQSLKTWCKQSSGCKINRPCQAMLATSAFNVQVRLICGNFTICKT